MIIKLEVGEQQENRGEKLAKFKLSKTKSQFYHTKKRMRERYGIDLSKPEYNAIIGMIGSNSADVVFLFKQSCSRAIIKFNFKGREVYAVYNGVNKTLRTVLTKDQCESLIKEETFITGEEDYK